MLLAEEGRAVMLLIVWYKLLSMQLTATYYEMHLVLFGTDQTTTYEMRLIVSGKKLREGKLDVLVWVVELVEN